MFAHPIGIADDKRPWTISKAIKVLEKIMGTHRPTGIHETTLRGRSDRDYSAWSNVCSKIELFVPYIDLGVDIHA